MSEDSKALAVVDQSTAALAAFGVTEDEPIKPSNLDLIQPIQCADEPGLIAGRFRDRQSNIQYPEINIVPIFMGPGRVCFPPGGELGAKPICRSKDGKFPIIQDELVPQDGGLGCAKCPKSQWKRINGKNIASECKDTMTFLFAELETQFVYRFKAWKTGLPPVRDLKDTIKKQVRMAKFKGVFLPPYGMTFKMTSVKLSKNGKTYFIPKFTPTGQVHPDDLPAFARIADFFNRRGDEAIEAEAATDPVSQVLEGEYVQESGTEYEAA